MSTLKCELTGARFRHSVRNMANPLTSEAVRDLLRGAVGENQKAWADANRIAPAYVSDVLNRRREPGPAILRALGLTKTVAYVRAS